MGEIYLDTIDRERKIRKAGYQLITMWEKDFDEMLKEREVQELLQDFTYIEPLLPRDAYYGGRTGACKMYYKAKPGEKIYYVDFTSLYPAVMHRGQGSRSENVKGQNGFPIGKPTIITNPEDQDITNYFGIAKVTVTPPNDLYHPLLPYRANNKLLFPLCRSCAEHNSSLSKKDGRREIRRCSHSTTERQWTGTYCTCELSRLKRWGIRSIVFTRFGILKNHHLIFSRHILSLFCATSRKPLAIPPDVTLQKNNRRTLTIIFRTKV